MAGIHTLLSKGLSSIMGGDSGGISGKDIPTGIDNGSFSSVAGLSPISKDVTAKGMFDWATGSAIRPVWNKANLKDNPLARVLGIGS